MRFPIFLLGTLGLLAGAAALRAQTPPVPPRPLALSLEPEAVAVSGLTPKAKAVFLGITREVGEDDYPTVRVYQEEVEDTDGDGSVELPVKGPLPKRALFVVIDSKTGNAQLATTAEFGLRRRGFLGAGPGLDSGGLARLAEQSQLAQVVLVRPGIGIWTVLAADGEESLDEDGGVDGGFEVALDHFVPVGSSPPPPTSFLPTDVLALVDPTTFEVVVTNVGTVVAP